MRCDRLWYNARLMTMAVARSDLGVIEDGIVAAKDGRIVYAGPAADAPAGIGLPTSESGSTAGGSSPG